MITIYLVALQTAGAKPRPVESHSGARETIIAGPYHNLIPYMRRDREAEGVEEETSEGMSPHHPTRDLGSVVSSLSRAPAENGFYA